jgi:hypothetical protein
MFTVSARTLNLLSALVWYGGGIAMLLKGRSLLAEAEALNPGLPWPWLAAVVSLLLGGLQAKFLFARSCKKNLDRIAALDRPRVWQFFRPGFFVLLAIMIAAGATLSRMAHSNYAFLIGVAMLDLIIAVSLLGSSVVFWQEKAFASKRER